MAKETRINLNKSYCNIRFANLMEQLEFEVYIEKKNPNYILSLCMIVHTYFAFIELLLVIMLFIMKLMIYNSFLLFLLLRACLIIRKQALNTILISKQFSYFLLLLLVIKLFLGLNPESDENLVPTLNLSCWPRPCVLCYFFFK